MIETIIPREAGSEDRAAFKSMEAALRFALGNQYIADPGTLARFQRRTHRVTSIFDDKIERAAWAGDIRRRIGTMHPHRVAILFVRYAPRSFPCSCRRPCCSGWAVNEEWQENLAIIVEAAATAVAGKLSNRQLRMGVVRRWCGADKVNIGLLADKCGVEGRTQAAHLNLGKAMGLKSSDAAIAALCCSGPGWQGCHEEYDQGKRMDKDERRKWLRSPHWQGKAVAGHGWRGMAGLGEACRGMARQGRP